MNENKKNEWMTEPLSFQEKKKKKRKREGKRRFPHDRLSLDPVHAAEAGIPMQSRLQQLVQTDFPKCYLRRK